MARLPLSIPLPTLDWVRLALAPLLVFIVAGMDRGYQTDYWQHLARGRLIAQEGRVVSEDRFTFTAAGRAMQDNNWLSQLLYYRLHMIGGLELVQCVNAIGLAAAVGIAVALAWAVSRSTGIAAAAGVFAFLGLWQTLLIRPQSFSLLLFMGTYALLIAAERRIWLLWMVPPVMGLWANVHGGFAIGLLLVGGFTLAAGIEWARQACVRRGYESNVEQAGSGRQFGALTACFAACGLATLINPYGWRLYDYAAAVSNFGLERGIEEWLPPGSHLWIGKVFLLSLVLLAFLSAASSRRLSLREGVLLVVFLLPALAAVRMVAWWVLVMTPILARLAAGVRGPDSATMAREARRPSIAAAGVLAALLATALLSTPWLQRFNPVLGVLRPEGRTENRLQELSEQLAASGQPRRIFSRLEWGNYFAWSAWPRSRVFMEGHVELYPDELWRQYLTISAGQPGWDHLLEWYRVDALVLDVSYHTELLRQARSSPHWWEQARTGEAVLLVRYGSMAGTPLVAPPVSAGFESNARFSR